MRWTSIISWTVAIAAVGLAAVGQTRQSSSSTMSFQLTSPAFASGSAIGRQYTCDGADQSPELHWAEAPTGTVTFALVVHDPDAPVGDWVHWIAWNIPATSHSLPGDFPRQDQLEDGTRQGRNDFHKIGYNGPCPPSRKDHKYFFQLYALNTKLDLAAGASRAELDSALKGHILAEAEYVGVYRR